MNIQDTSILAHSVIGSRLAVESLELSTALKVVFDSLSCEDSRLPLAKLGESVKSGRTETKYAESEVEQVVLGEGGLFDGVIW